MTAFLPLKNQIKKKLACPLAEATKKSAQHTLSPEGTERDNQLQKKRGALKFPFFFAAGIAL